ncbi:MAG: hypothetical protein IBX61_09250 [Thermoleophilia bacterium]|nr:hypothetical protein [Thermoleophilia bacterium]
MEALPRMSWRRFFVLLNGLSAESRFVLAITPEGGTEPTKVVTSPKAIERITQFR